MVFFVEWEVCVNLVVVYCFIVLFGWDDFVFIYIFVCVFGLEYYFLINLYGMMFDEIMVLLLVKVDFDGCKVFELLYEINLVGFMIYSVVYVVCDDV